jgi:hypothetical protein
VMAECGCIRIPEEICVLDPKEVHCERHGWVKILRAATSAEIMGVPPVADTPEPMF